MAEAPETEARNTIIKAVEETYAVEKFPVKPGALHRMLGDTGTVIGVSPESTSRSGQHAVVAEIFILVQFYGQYKKEIEPRKQVDPTTVENFAERLREKFASGIDPKTANNWYFSLETIKYPIDPVGNKTRYEATIKAYGNNTALKMG